MWMCVLIDEISMKGMGELLAMLSANMHQRGSMFNLIYLAWWRVFKCIGMRKNTCWSSKDCVWKNIIRKVSRIDKKKNVLFRR
jgi:hypothetical protein